MREHKIMVRVGDEEKTLFEEIASSLGLSTATWARMELLRAARGQPARNSQNGKAHQLPLLSLFCGAGGMDEGFRQGGFHTELAIDIDQECIRTFSLNHPRSKAHQYDVRDLTVEVLDRLAERRVEPIGVIGGPPCQSFSVSNVYQLADDPRHRLPEVYASLFSALNRRSPISFFVFENVPGLLGKKHLARYEKFKDLSRKAGFRIYERVLDAKNYGVPQERPRVFVVGINEEHHPAAEWEWPLPENRVKTVRETIGNLAEPAFNGKGLNRESFPEHPNHWCLVPRSQKFENGALRQGEMFGRSFRTLSWDKPSWTVAYGHREVHVHPNGKRRLSIYEAMLLQTFPKSYVLTGNLSAQVRLVSDAVPPRLAWHLACALRRTLGI